MGGVSNADQLPGGASTRTVEEPTMALGVIAYLPTFPDWKYIDS